MSLIHAQTLCFCKYKSSAPIYDLPILILAYIKPAYFRFEALAKIVLQSPHFYDFFKYVEVSTFDIASDAFVTFKERPKC